MAAPQVIDPAAIANLRSLGGGDNGAFLAEIVGIFIADTPQRLLELEQSLQAGDRDRFVRAAHSIKGSSGNLGTTALQAAAERLERDASQAPLDALAPQLVVLKAEYDRAQAELERIVKETARPGSLA